MENQTQSTIDASIPDQPPEPTVKAKKPLSKLILATTVVLIFLALALPFGVYLGLRAMGIHPKPSTITINATESTKTPNPTLAWKTYYDKNEGFSFMYPNNSEVTAQKQNSLAAAGLIDGLNIQPTDEINKNIMQGSVPEDTWFVISISSEPVAPNTELKSYLIAHAPTSPFLAMGVKTQTPDIKQYDNGQIKGFFEQGIEYDSGYTSHVYAIKGSKIYEFGITGWNGIPSKQGLKTLDQIISTFKFTDKNTPTPTITQQIDTSTWKTYTNSDYKVTFKYPVDWNANLGNDNSINLTKCTTGSDTTGKLSQFCQYIKLYTQTENLPLKDWANNFYNSKLPSPTNLYPPLRANEISIGGQKGLEVFVPGGSYFPEYILTNYNGKGYIFEYFISDPVHPSVLEGMIDTFKFIP